MRAVARGVLLAIAALAAGCGWHAGTGPPLSSPWQGKSYSANATVGVELFDRSRQVLERNLEPELHAALARAVVDRNLSLTSSDRADLVLRGTILEYRRRGGIRNEDNQLLESGIRLRVEAQLVDRATGQELSRSTQHVWSSYALDGVPPEFDARERSFGFLARKLVSELFHPGIEPLSDGVEPVGRRSFPESDRTQ